MLTALTACGGASDQMDSLIAVVPAAAELQPGEALKFETTPDAAVDWTVMEADGGAIDETGVYVAPEAEGTYTVAAYSASGYSTTAVRVKKNLRVDVLPAAATLAPGEKATFTASVTTNQKGVEWSVLEGATGGTITANGVYTAPQTPGTYTVVATSTAVPERSDTATVTVKVPPDTLPPPTQEVAVAVSPRTASVQTGTTVQLTATVTGSDDTSVTWSVVESGGGTVSSTGLYTAPTTAGTYHVVATSRADTSKSASATITVSSPTISKPVISSFKASPSSITAGESTTLSWSVSGDTSLTINNGVGTVTGLSSKTVSPTTNTTYVLTATNAAGSVTASVDVAVAAAPTSPTTPPPPPGVVPAFPGAQGGGALSKGGRGGKVIEVTNLNDSGTGSLRACIDATGPRTCVFRVAGTIVLKTRIIIDNPYLTIAGQTSPGGIQIRAAKNAAEGGPMDRALITVLTHDVTIRFLRLRTGRVTDSPTQQGNPIKISDGSYNVIVDHCSLFWTQDQSYSIRSEAVPVYNTTLSWSILTEPLADHPTNVLIGASNETLRTQMVDNDFHHNFLGTSNHRNPQMNVRRVRWINNVVYNYKYLASQLGGGMQADFINNIYKPGPINPQPRVREIVWRTDSSNPGTASLYVSGNRTFHHPNPTDYSTEWNHIVGVTTAGANGTDEGPLSTSYRRTSPLPGAGVPITPEPASTLEASLGLGSTTPLLPVGASRRLDANGRWVDAYDAADRRVIQEYKTNSAPSALVNDGVHPTITAASAPYPDADHDGMSDVWESARGLNPNDPSDGNIVGADGYTNLERFLNGQ